jgi:hypothetical protein
MQDIVKQLNTEATRVRANGVTRARNRTRVANLMLAAAARLDAAEHDTRRVDWLADRDNPIGAVQLPDVCVMNNLSSLRGAIDEAMRLDPEVWNEILRQRHTTSAV